MHASVMPFIKELRYVFKMMRLPMLQHKPSPFQQQWMAKNKAGDFLKVFQIIRRIGKNNMVLLFTYRNKPEDIHPYRVNPFQIHFLRNLSDKLHRPVVVVHQVDLRASA